MKIQDPYGLYAHIDTVDEARQSAIDWQNWASGQNLSMLEVSDWQSFFKTLAEKFSLTDEFEENGII